MEKQGCTSQLCQLIDIFYSYITAVLITAYVRSIVKNHSYFRKTNGGEKIGLHAFDDLAVDTEDRERVCWYYEDMMDILGLESTHELLNNWMY